MKYFFIFNPSARQGRSKKAWAKILSLLEKKRLIFDYRVTKKPKDATDFAAGAVEEGWSTIVAVGGDGTICEVINGLFKQDGSRAGARLGVLHIGTSPDFNHYHRIPINLEKAIEALFREKTRLIDIGKIIYLGAKREKDPPSSEELPNHPARKVDYFASNVNIGLGPQIAKKANARYRRYLGDFLGTLSATVVSLLSYKRIDLRLKVDGKEVNCSRLINLTVGKDPYLASGMRVFSDITPQDGRLYILSVEAASLSSLLFNLYKLYRGNFLEYQGAKLTYAKEVEIAHHPLYPEVEFDGDVKGYLPAKIGVIPKALEVIVG